MGKRGSYLLFNSVAVFTSELILKQEMVIALLKIKC